MIYLMCVYKLIITGPFEELNHPKENLVSFLAELDDIHIVTYFRKYLIWPLNSNAG